MLKYLKNSLFVLIISLLYCFNISYSQKTYETKQGTVIINTKYGDSSLSSTSKSLNMRLDYTTSMLKMEVDLNSFKTGIDTLDILLENSQSKIYFDADLGLTEIDTKNHSLQTLKFNGFVYSNISKKKINVLVNGKIQHISEKSDIASCMLWLDFAINTGKLNWNLPAYKLDENIRVQIIQVILSRKN